MPTATDPRPRCPWAVSSQLMLAYHDHEWGQPCHDDQALFERLVLESFQAGLSWATILHKREHFRQAFDGWDVARIATYGSDDVTRLMADAGIVRNRRKIEATITNAHGFLAVQAERSVRLITISGRLLAVARCSALPHLPGTRCLRRPPNRRRWHVICGDAALPLLARQCATH